MSKFIIPAVLLVLLIVGHFVDRTVAVHRAITVTTTTLNTEYQAKLNEAITKAQVTESFMRKDAEAIGNKKDETIKTINSTLAAALVSLQDRPERPASGTNTKLTGDRKACTGRELYRQDAGFLAREAARANKVKAERDMYYERYESARAALEAAKKPASR
jgi:hypothetical protein